uniref:Uncharacterized protein n=1 Tax=Melopsittacus undulatus TaxID=13146 RepID=A0A8V5H618_MELUD
PGQGPLPLEKNLDNISLLLPDLAHSQHRPLPKGIPISNTASPQYKKLLRFRDNLPKSLMCVWVCGPPRAWGIDLQVAWLWRAPGPCRALRDLSLTSPGRAQTEQGA